MSFQSPAQAGLQGKVASTNWLRINTITITALLAAVNGANDNIKGVATLLGGLLGKDMTTAGRGGPRRSAPW